VRSRWLIGAFAGICLMSTAFAQTSAQPQEEREQEAVYSPLFSETMIQRAAPEQGARMRKSEAGNRQRFDARQQALRDQRAAAKQANEEARQKAERAPAPRRGKSKVFKWVDANGRVHFGDAPQGQNAKEVKVGGAARIQGTPPPPPGGQREDRDQ